MNSKQVPLLQHWQCRGQGNIINNTYVKKSHNLKCGTLTVLGAFSMLQNPTIAMSVCSSIRMYQRGSHWTEFRDICYWKLSWTPAEKTQILLQSGKNVVQFA